MLLIGRLEERRELQRYSESHEPEFIGVWGVSVNTCSWRGKASGSGAQIDLVLDRRDGVVNLCEAKWVGSGEQYRIEKDYLQDLLRKREVFAQETGTSKALHITMLTPGGVAHNSCWHSIAAEITAEDLFS